MKKDHEELIRMFCEQGIDAHAAYNIYLKTVLPTCQPVTLGLNDVLRIYAEDER